MPRRPRPPSLRTLALSFVEAAVLVAAAAAIGLAVNAVRPDRLPLVRRAPFDLYTDCPEVSEDIPEISPDKLGPRPKGVVFVDARKAWDYCAGHLPGALFLPMYETEPPDAATVSRLRSLRGRWVVVYGDPTVQSGRRLATALANARVRGVHLLAGGIRAWKARGLPIEKCEIPVRSAQQARALRDVVLVDARDEEVCRRNRLPGAVCLPFDDVLPPEPEVLERLRAHRGPILVYDGRSGPDARGRWPAWAVAAELKARGIRDVQVLRGPLEELERQEPRP